MLDNEIKLSALLWIIALCKDTESLPPNIRGDLLRVEFYLQTHRGKEKVYEKKDNSEAD